MQSIWIPVPKFGLALWICHPAYVKPFEKLIDRLNEAGSFKKWAKFMLYPNYMYRFPA